MYPYIFLDICHQSLIGNGPSFVLVHAFKNDGISRHPVYLQHYKALVHNRPMIIYLH